MCVCGLKWSARSCGSDTLATPTTLAPRGGADGAKQGHSASYFDKALGNNTESAYRSLPIHNKDRLLIYIKDVVGWHGLQLCLTPPECVSDG